MAATARLSLWAGPALMVPTCKSCSAACAYRHLCLPSEKLNCKLDDAMASSVWSQRIAMAGGYCVHKEGGSSQCGPQACRGTRRKGADLSV